MLNLDLILDNILLSITHTQTLTEDFISTRNLMQTETYLQVLEVNTISDIEDFLNLEIPLTFLQIRVLDLNFILKYLESLELYNLCFKLKTILNNI